jgi:hypothetical protein
VLAIARTRARLRRRLTSRRRAASFRAAGARGTQRLSLRSINSDVTLFKNIRLGGNRRLQLRWEIYNVFNQWKKRRRPHLAEDMGILGEVSPSVRAGGGAPAPVEKR